MTDALPPDAGSDSSTAALARLRARLAELAAAGETRLPPERELAEALGIGRRALRRALDVLEAEGRLWRRQGKGTFLGPEPEAPEALRERIAPKASFHDVMEARLRLEPQLALLAALKATAEDVEKMRVLAARIADTGDADASELWDGSLHRQIARATRNPLLLGLFDLMDAVRQDPAWTALRERARTRSRREVYVAQHAAIIDAIAARDPQGAEAAMRRHIVTLQHNLILAAEGEDAHAAE